MKTKLTKFGIIFICILSLTWLIDRQSQADELTPQQMADLEFQQKRKARMDGYHKYDHPSEFAKMHAAMRTKDGEDRPGYQVNYRSIELEKLSRSEFLMSSYNSSNNSNLEWIERGPSNVPGRTRGLVVVPSDKSHNTWLAGSVGGGIWKTTNSGQSWSNKTPNYPNLATTTIVMAASDNNIVYAGTGEKYASLNSVSGDGILKSIDGGETWKQLTSTTKNDNFRDINRIIVDPTNPNIVLAATSKGYWQSHTPQSRIMRSTDGGISWTKVYESQSSHVDHIVAAPSDFNIQYASINKGGIIKSTDAGITWTDKKNGITTTGRMEIAVSPTNPYRVYVSAQGRQTSRGSDLFVTDDGGERWMLVKNSSGTNPNFLGGQGYYDNTIAVHPYNDNIVYVGGVDMLKFTIVGGLKIKSVEEKSTASFMSFVNFSGADFNDGSVYISTTGGTDIKPKDFTSVEIRFGPGKKQKAHRFLVPQGTNAGVKVKDYTYADYVDVPFEVWDTKRNKQLMVSFRDQERNKVFNLNDGTETDKAKSREFLYIHSIDYNPTKPNPTLTKVGKRAYKQMYFMWPVTPIGVKWNPNNHPTSKLIINHGKEEAQREVTYVADSYRRYGGPNRFSQSADHQNVTGPHPDHHGIYLAKVDEANKTFKIINTNDGGVYYTNTSTIPGENQGDWSFGGRGFNTTQFYGIDKKRGANEYIGGTQDNGTWKSRPNENANANTPYRRQIGGDGFEVAWHYDDPDKILGSLYFNNIRKSVNGGRSWYRASIGLSNWRYYSPFYTKIANLKSDPDVVYAVQRTGVGKSENFADSWNVTTISHSKWNFHTFLTDVDISHADNNIVWAGSGMSDSRSLFVSKDKGNSFSVTKNYDRSLGVITGMATHPTEKKTFFALFSFAKNPKILKTTDLGESWEDISGFGLNGTSSKNGFPDVAVYSLLVMPDNPNVYWVGTEIGLIESTDAGATWHKVTSGMPHVAIWDMKYDNGQVVLGTHGRGIWSVEYSKGILGSSKLSTTKYLGKQKMEVEIDLATNYDKIEIFVENKLELTKTKGLSGGKHKYILPKIIEKPSKLYFVVYRNGKKYKSKEYLSVKANFAPTIKTAVSNKPEELYFEIISNEEYTDIEIFLNDKKVGNIDKPKHGSNQITVKGLSGGKNQKAYVKGTLKGKKYKSKISDVNIITSILNLQKHHSINIFPNPASEFFNIDLEEGQEIKNLLLYDTQGRQVIEKYNYRNGKLDISSLKSGVYFVSFMIGDEQFSERVQVLR